jgi:ArsR family transcriptional regulator, arsenate/arsenite/antimonite-responsive transcriptional repressor
MLAVSTIPCCTPILRSRLDANDAALLASRFSALGDATRLQILSLIAERGEVCACELVGVVDLAQPTVSHHLKVLHDAGLLDRERRGRWIHYRISPGAVDDLRDALATPVAV